jgi:hypothetical protein
LNVWDFSRRITDGQKMPVENRPLRAADSNPLSETKTFVAVGFSESDRVKNCPAILRKKSSPFQVRQQKRKIDFMFNFMYMYKKAVITVSNP